VDALLLSFAYIINFLYDGSPRLNAFKLTGISGRKSSARKGGVVNVLLGDDY